MPDVPSRQHKTTCPFVWNAIWWLRFINKNLSAAKIDSSWFPSLFLLDFTASKNTEKKILEKNEHVSKLVHKYKTHTQVDMQLYFNDALRANAIPQPWNCRFLQEYFFYNVIYFLSSFNSDCLNILFFITNSLASHK